MQKLPHFQPRSDRNTPSAMERSISRYDYLFALFSLVTSLLVYGASSLVIAIMVYHNYSIKWTFICYVVSSGWLFIMNITSSVVMITSKKIVRRENPRTCRQTSVNLDLLNNPNGSRHSSYPPVERFEQTNRSRLSERPGHTPPPSYEDVSLVVSGDDNSESFSSGTPQEPSNDKALYHVLDSANEIRKVRETMRGEYGSKKKTQKYSPENHQEGWKSHSRKGLDSNQVVVERVVQNLGDEKARLILHKRIEDRRNQLDRRLEGDSLRKMNEYCTRDLKKDLEKRSPRQPSELTPKESLRRNLKAKYGSSAENFIRDIHSSRDSVSSACQPRNIERCELPRVHTKSTLSLNPSTDDGNCQRSVKSSHSSGIHSSGLSLQEVHMHGSQPDIRTANEVGLPMYRTWKQKPLKLPDRAATKANLDTSFSLKHLDDRKRRDGNPCSRSKSMPGRQTSRENDDERF